MANPFITGGPPRYDHQRKGLNKLIRTGGVGALLFDPGLGKGHPLDERVLTPSGWQEVGDLEVGDHVIGSDGHATRVTGVFDRGELPVYRVTFRDGASVRVDADHLWQVSYRANGKEYTTVRETREIMQDRRIHRLYLPTTAVHHPKRDLPMDPYLLGGLLADGYLSGSSVAWSKGEPTVAEEMHKAAARDGWIMKISPKHAGHVSRWTVQGALPVVRELGVDVASGDKFIPEVYFTSSIEQRTALVNGLFDGDGSVRWGRGTARYTTSSAHLAGDVLRLLWSLGVGATRALVPHPKGDYWQVNVHGNFNPFRASPLASSVKGTKRNLRRSFTSVESEGVEPVRCIKVEAKDSLYVTKDYIVTHNTATTLDYASLLALKSPTGEARVLVAAPLVAVDTWVDQAEKWVSPQVNFWAEALGGNLLQRAEAIAARGGNGYRNHLGPGKDRKPILNMDADPRALHHKRSLAWDSRPKVDPRDGPNAVPGPRLVLTVINTDTLSQRRTVGSKTMADILVDSIKRYQPDLVVLDESHLIKSASSNISRIMARIANLVKRRIILTGTVMPASPLDVFGQWRFLEPYAFGHKTKDGVQGVATYGGFKEDFAELGGWMGKEVVSFKNLDRMQSIMARNAIVARKEEALDLPETTDVTLHVELSPKEKKAYNEMKNQLSVQITPTVQSTSTNKLVQMMRLRQITSGYLPDDSGTMTHLGTAKADTVASLVQDTLAGEKRIVIFALFTEEINALVKRLSVKGTEVMKITGSTPVDERIKMRQRFGSEEDTRMVIVAQIKTLSLAVNELVTANHAIFASMSQRRDEYIQARDRLNRIGQKRPVTFWHALVPGSVDQVILKAHTERTSLENAMLKHIHEESPIH